jgi:hypothetical protein
MQTREVRAYRIDAREKWQGTGVFINAETDNIWVSYVGGGWTANPAWKTTTGAKLFVDGEGNRNYIGKEGYALPGVAEGALVGRIENGTPFYVGNRGHLPTEVKGQLYLIINDDLDGRYGKGYSDNEGYLDVVIGNE